MSMDTIANAALRFYEARQARAAAYKAFQEWCRENIADGPSCLQEGTTCYRLGPQSEGGWCSICTDRQPHWNAYREAATKSARAMSALRGACARELKARQS